MCFSATSSFAAAALAGTAGALTVAQVSRLRELPLATVPVLFAIQQAIEGLLWLVLPGGAQTWEALYLANSFALIALVAWPIYGPTSAALVEDIPWRRNLSWLLAAVGALIAVYSAQDIALHPYRAVIASHSLCYINNSPYPSYALALYASATCGVFLLSSHAALRVFGLIVVCGLAVSLEVFREDLVSVWCFFAAVASGCLLFHFRRRASVAA